MELHITSCLGPLFEIETLGETPRSADPGFSLPSIHEQASGTFNEGVEKRNSNITSLEEARGVFRNDRRSVGDFLGLFFPQMWKKAYRGWKLSIEELSYLQYVSSAVWESYEKKGESVSSLVSAFPLSPLSSSINVHGSESYNSTTMWTSSNSSGLPHGSSVNNAENNRDRGRCCDRKSSGTVPFLPHITSPHFQLPIPLFKVILQGETVQERFHSLSQLHSSTCFLYRVLSWDLGYALRHGGSQFGAYFIGYTKQEDSAGLGLGNGLVNRENATPTRTTSMATTTASKKVSTLRSPCVSSREGEIVDFIPPTMSFSHHGDVLFFPCSASKSSTCPCTFPTSPEGDSPSSHSFSFRLDSHEFCEGEESSRERESRTEDNKHQEESLLLSWNAGMPFSLYMDESHSVRLAQEKEVHNSCVKPHVLIPHEGRVIEGSTTPQMAPSRRRIEEDDHPKEEVDVTQTKVGSIGENRKKEKKKGASPSSGELPSMVNSRNQIFSFCSFFSSSAAPHDTPSTMELSLPEGEGKSQRNTTIITDSSTILPCSFSPFSSSSPSSTFLKAGVMVRTTLELHRLDAIRACRVARSVGKQAYWCGVVNHRVESWPQCVAPVNNHPQNGGDPSHRAETMVHHHYPSHVLGHSHCPLTTPQEGIEKEKCMSTHPCSHTIGRVEAAIKNEDTSQSHQFLFSTAEYLSCNTLSAEEVAVMVLPIS